MTGQVDLLLDLYESDLVITLLDNVLVVVVGVYLLFEYTRSAVRSSRKHSFIFTTCKDVTQLTAWTSSCLTSIQESRLHTSDAS